MLLFKASVTSVVKKTLCTLWLNIKHKTAENTEKTQS